MREQMKPLGLSIDWSREFATCDPEYYGQQQALFLDFLEAGLIDEAYVTVSPVFIGGRGVASPIGGDGLNFSEIIPLELRALRVEEGEAYLHYRVSRPASRAGSRVLASTYDSVNGIERT
ncbi:MAG: hypothetical protein ABGY41_18360, partial [Candidatus Poribacteria bacterium]